MKHYLLAGTALALLPTLAMAGERVPASWTGFYFGGQIGGFRSHADVSGAFADSNSSSTWSSKQAWTSFLIGGFAGYDHQLGRVVLGIEGDGNARIGDGTGSLPAVYRIVLTDNWTSRADWDASLRGRIGFLATDQLLLYATGGVAFAKFRFSNPDASSAGGWPITVYWGTENLYGGYRTGWTVGAGAQYALTRNLNIRIEYRHSDYGTRSHTGQYDSGKGGTGSYRSKITDDRVTGGFAYKF